MRNSGKPPRPPIFKSKALTCVNNRIIGIDCGNFKDVYLIKIFWNVEKWIKIIKNHERARTNISILPYLGTYTYVGLHLS